MSAVSVGQRVLAILEAGVAGSPSINGALGTATLRRSLTTTDIRYGLPELQLIEPFPNVNIRNVGFGIDYQMAEGERQTRFYRYVVDIYAEVSGHGATGATFESQCAAAEEDVEILSNNVVKLLMAQIQDTGIGDEWYLLSFGDVSIEDGQDEKGVWVKIGHVPIQLEVDWSRT